MTDEIQVPEGTVDELLDWVGDDPEKAQAVLDVEVAKGDDARVTLVGPLQDLLGIEEPADEVPATAGEPNEAAPVPDYREPVPDGADVTTAVAKGIADRRAARG